MPKRSPSGNILPTARQPVAGIRRDKRVSSGSAASLTATDPPDAVILSDFERLLTRGEAPGVDTRQASELMAEVSTFLEQHGRRLLHLARHTAMEISQ